MNNIVHSIQTIDETNNWKTRINKWRHKTFLRLSNWKLEVSNHFHQASGIQDWEKTSIKHNFVLFESIDDYLNERETISKRRLYTSYAIAAIQFVVAVLFILLAFNGNEMMVALGSPFHIAGKKNARNCHIILTILYLYGATIRSVFIYHERRRKCYYLSILKWISSESRGELDDRHYTKICKRMKLIGKYFTKYMDFLALGASLVLLVFSVIAYHFEHNLDDSLARLLVFSIVNSYLLWQTTIATSCTFFIYYTTCVYLEYRFDQLNN